MTAEPEPVPMSVLDSRPSTLGMMIGAKELAAILGLHYVTVLKALNTGRIQGVRTGKKWAVTKDEVERIIREGF